MQVKEKEKKFSGDLGDQNLLQGDAKRFYLDKVDGYATSFQQAVAMLEDEYNSTVRETRVKNYLNSLRVSSYISQGASGALSRM